MPVRAMSIADTKVMKPSLVVEVGGCNVCVLIGLAAVENRRSLLTSVGVFKNVLKVLLFFLLYKGLQLSGSFNR